jgi:hypothetical protein
MRKKLEVISLAVAMAACAGCRREEVRVYTAPKDPPPRQETAHHPGDGHDHGNEGEPAPRPRPQLSWKLPEGWREVAPGRMNVATFSIRDANQEAQVTITPLPMLEGRDAIIVNMWREQVGLKPLSDEEVTKQLQDVVVGSEGGKLFEVTGKAAEGEAPARIVTAMVHRGDASWFYKLSGHAALVETQKPAFIEFLKSIQIKEPAATDTRAADGAPSLKWEIPAGWKQLPAGQMQVARFAVPPRNDATGDVFISVFPTDTGGTLANVNRWRRQLKLKETSETELSSLVTPLGAGLPNAVLVDMTNNTQQLVGAIVPRDGQWWFYKLLGDAAAVAPERENFVRFAKSVP